MRPFAGLLSIDSGTNKAVSSCGADWKPVRVGSFIQIDADSVFYQITKISPVFYIKEFYPSDTFALSLKGDTGINISRGDIVTITYKEYELGALIKIKNPGKNYKIDEIVRIAGGNPSVRKSDNLAENTKFVVNEIDEFGGIVQLGLVEKGRYTIKPERDSGLLSDLSGDGAEIEVEYEQIGNRIKLEKTVRLVKNEKDKTLVIIDSPIPVGIENGDLSIEKWQMSLSGSYGGESKRNCKYQIFSDFTPCLGMPMLLKNSQNQDILINKSLSLIDAKFAELEQRVKILESKN